MDQLVCKFGAPKANPIVPSGTVYKIAWADNIAGLTEIYGKPQIERWIESAAKVDSAAFARKSAENGVPLSDILAHMNTWTPADKPLTDADAVAVAQLKKLGADSPDALKRLLAKAGINYI